MPCPEPDSPLARLTISEHPRSSVGASAPFHLRVDPAGPLGRSPSGRAVILGRCLALHCFLPRPRAMPSRFGIDGSMLARGFESGSYVALILAVRITLAH